jgi:phosphoribosylformylglycinamidine synthase
MMAFVAAEHVDEVLSIAGKWEIDSAVVGVVKDGSTLTIRHQGELVAEVPAASLADAAPLYDRPVARPDWMDDLWGRAAGEIDEEPAEVLLRLLDDPALGASNWIHEQYDHMLFLNTVVGPGSDGSLIRIRGTNKGMAVSTDGNGRLCQLDPRGGSARLVYEAALNVAVTGARPLAAVDNLNFGNPEKPSVMWQFVESVEGISEACESLGRPVVGGNVSFYNETDGGDIHPTPVIGLLGLADPMPQAPPRLSNARNGMEVWEVGPCPSSNLAGSAVQRVLHDELTGRPSSPAPEIARRVIGIAAELAHRVPVLHDVSDGGRAVAVAEICIASGVGATILGSGSGELFSEDPHRFIAVFEAGSVDMPLDISRRVGTIGGDGLVFGESEPIALDVLVETHRNAIPRRMAG